MAKLYNLARMTTATTGTGTITLGSAVSSYLSFASSGVLDGETVTYAIADGSNREIGRGVYTSSGTALTRTVLESTNSNTAINLSGNAEVFITAAAEDIANVNETNTFTASQIIQVTDNTNAALRITQLGTGNAILVEDSANPDSTPFRVDQNGTVSAGGAITTGGSLTVAAASSVLWSGRGILTSPAAGGIQLGPTDAAAPVAQTLSAQSVVAGTTDTAGQALTIRGSRGTGTGAGGAIVLQTAPASTTGSTQNAAVERMRIDSAGNVGIGVNNPSASLQILGSTQNRLWLSGFGINNRHLFVRANGTVASPTIVASGDAIGSVNFFGYDGAANIELANMTATIDGTPGTNDMPGRLVFSTTADGASSPTERLRISNAGVTTITGTGIINANSASDALRITQTGTGNSILVEDSANPDASPFLVTNDGQVISGSTTSISGTGGTSRFQSNNSLAGFSAHYAGVDANPAINTFLKSRGGAIVNVGDQIGNFRFEGFDGTNFIQAAAIIVTVDGTPGTNDMPGRLGFFTTADGASSVTERMRIDSNGNVLLRNAIGLGYGTGCGGTVTQATSKTTAVTLNKPTGQITMNNAALAAATSVTFTLNNSLLTAQDTLIVNHSTTGGTSGAYLIEALTVGAGTVVIRVTNITGGSLSEAAVINFAIIKGITS